MLPLLRVTTLYEHLNSNHLLFNKQFGFKPKDSTVTVVSSFGDEVLYCGTVFLDMAKAFDTVGHGILLTKLSTVGLSPIDVQWFETYLGHRKQRASCGHELSEELPVTLAACTSRQNFGTLVVSYFCVNDLPTVVKHSGIALYADDRVIYTVMVQTSKI